MTQENAKSLACKFLDWFIEDNNREVYNALIELPENFATEALFDLWFSKYFNPDTINLHNPSTPTNDTE